MHSLPFRALRSTLVACVLSSAVLACSGHGEGDEGTAVDLATTKESVPTGLVKMVRPRGAVENTLDANAVLAKVREAGAVIETDDVTAVTQEDGVVRLYGGHGRTAIPLAEIDHDEVFAYGAMGMGEAEGDDLRVREANVVVRFSPKSDEPLRDEPRYFFVVPRGERLPALVPMSDHALTSDGLFMRVDDAFLDGKGKTRFAFVQKGESAFRLEGSFTNGYVCDGSLLWKEADGTWRSSTREYGVTRNYAWKAEGDSLALTGPSTTDPPPAIRAELRACPGKTDEELAATVASLAFDPETKVTTSDALVPFESGKNYPLGTVVRVDDTTYKVLVSAPKPLAFDCAECPPRDPSSYVFANWGRTFGEDQGRRLARIYVRRDGRTREVAKTADYLKAVAADIHGLSEKRIQASKDVETSQESTRWQMQIAEAKASTVDQPSKLLGIALTSFAFDTTVRGFQTAAPSVMGIKTAAANGAPNAFLGLQKSAVAGTTIGQRLLASFYLTAIQGAALSIEPILVTWDEKTPKEQLATAGSTIGKTGSVWLLRSIFPSGGMQWVSTAGAGLLMRWRKISNDAEIGFDNGNTWQVTANMAAGAATALVQMYAIRKGAGPGPLTAIGGAGVLVSEIIAGRGTPSVILGSLVEITSDALVKDPRIRPFAAVLARQVSALIQLTETHIRLGITGEMLDDARALRYEQIAKRDALLFLLREVPEARASLSPDERNTIVATAADPFAVLRAYYAD
ncbi:MAG: hypothetical protein U0169_11105 [Polyangiaceae bacterium]